MTLWPRSLRGRLLLLVVGAMVLVWLVAAAVTWRTARHEMDELLDGHLAQAAALLVVQQAGEFDDDAPRPDAPSLHRYAPKVTFQVWHEGRLAARSANAPEAPMTPSSEPGYRQGFRTLAIQGVAWRVFAAQGAQSDVQVYVGEQVDSRASILQALVRSMLGPVVLGLPLLALAAWWGVALGLAPLRRLSRLLRAREPQALEPVVLTGAPANTPTEMQPMLQALNDLFGRIRLLMESERRFTADAAHELRTPIAAIRTQAQVALAESDPAARRHALQATIEGCDRAARLIDQLLTLARLEAGGHAHRAPVDLAVICREVMADLAPRAIAKRQSLELEGDAPCIVEGDEALLRVLVRNLVDNAVGYSPAGARVHVRVGCEGERVRLDIDDSGPGLAPADRQRLGERFFRVLGSAQSGSGLGWSIVRRVASFHHAEVSVHASAELGGLAVSVTWAGHDPRQARPPFTAPDAAAQTA